MSEYHDNLWVWSGLNDSKWTKNVNQNKFLYVTCKFFEQTRTIMVGTDSATWYLTLHLIDMWNQLYIWANSFIVLFQCLQKP